MTWVRLDDQFPNHPKAIAAGPVACWLYVCGIAYANQYLTDGFIPDRQARRLIDADDIEPSIERLTAVGLWERESGGYRVHDYLDYQPSSEKVKAEREAARQRMANRRTSGEEPPNDLGSSEEVQENFAGSSEEVLRPHPKPKPLPKPSPISQAEAETTTARAREPAGKPPEVSQSEPFDALLSLCEATGADIASLSDGEKRKQLGKARQLLATGKSVADIGRCAGYNASQHWRTETVDMWTVEKGWGKWELAGKPAIAANGRASPATSRAAKARQQVDYLRRQIAEDEGHDENRSSEIGGHSPHRMATGGR